MDVLEQQKISVKDARRNDVKKTDDYKFLTGIGDYSGINAMEAIKNLEKYESTGFTPDQVQNMAYLYREKCKEVADLRLKLKGKNAKREKTCKTCRDNDDGLCDQTGYLVNNDDICEKWN